MMVEGDEMTMKLERVAIVRVTDGLHARPATQFVKLAKTFASDVEIDRGGKAANAKSSVKLMLLGIKEADEVIIRAEGTDAREALDQLVRFVETPDHATTPAAPVAEAPREATVAGAAGRGIGASEGTARGPVFAFFPEKLDVEARLIGADEADTEVARCHAAISATTTALTVQKSQRGANQGDIGILDALIEVAQDDDLIGGIEARIRGGFDAVSSTIAVRFEAMADPYIRARAEDIRAVTRAIALALLDKADVNLAAVPPGSILVAEEISAWDFAKAPVRNIAGIVCLHGAATSHLAIMARTHGIPAVLGCTHDPLALRAATTIGLDGRTGEVVLDPTAEALADLDARIARERAQHEALDHYRKAEPVTRGGQRIEIAANLGSLKEIEPAQRAGAMGVGLFRTELLFMEHATLPSEDEQAEVYATLARAFAPYPVVVRTLDVGGDKPVAGIEFPAEDNPFLGWRGVRMCLDRPDVFKPQLKALLRAATEGDIKIMVPMIADAGEVRDVRALLSTCAAELDAAGVAHGQPSFGIMIETPAAALLAEDLAPLVDFFSIGTNDLTQYIMAADRLNPRVASLNRADHPAVMRAIEIVCRAAKAHGIWVGVCGEAAARPDLIPRFVAMGVTELSMSPSSILRAKKAVIEA
jgi:phosphocarrier protein FPr